MQPQQHSKPYWPHRSLEDRCTVYACIHACTELVLLLRLRESAVLTCSSSLSETLNWMQHLETKASTAAPLASEDDAFLIADVVTADSISPFTSSELTMSPVPRMAYWHGGIRCLRGRRGRVAQRLQATLLPASANCSRC